MRELITESGTTLREDVEGGRYDCPACPERFDTVGDKKRHIRRSHR